jgi:hypothetical protein
MSGTEDRMSDARFRDTTPSAAPSAGTSGAGTSGEAPGIASDRPLRLVAETAEDLAVVSALVQDAVARAGEVAWMPRRRRMAMLLNRFRWEDRTAAERERRPYERVRACLLLDGVLAVRGRGVNPRDREATLSLLRIDFAPEPREGAAGGLVTISLAGGGEIALDVECIEARLVDTSRPWEAQAGAAPDHRLDDPD